MSVVNDVRPFVKSFQAFLQAAAKSYVSVGDVSTDEKVDAVFRGFRPQMEEVQKFIDLMPPTDGYSQLLKASWKVFTDDVLKEGDCNARIKNAAKHAYIVGCVVEAYAANNGFTMNYGVNLRPGLSSLEYVGEVHPMPAPLPAMAMPAPAPAQLAMPAPAMVAMAMPAPLVVSPDGRSFIPRVYGGAEAGPASGEQLGGDESELDRAIRLSLVDCVEGAEVSPLLTPGKARPDGWEQVGSPPSYGATGAGPAEPRHETSSQYLERMENERLERDIQEALRLSREEAKGSE